MVPRARRRLSFVEISKSVLQIDLETVRQAILDLLAKKLRAESLLMAGEIIT